jgi:hypothetical protein
MFLALLSRQHLLSPTGALFSQLLTEHKNLVAVVVVVLQTEAVLAPFPTKIFFTIYSLGLAMMGLAFLSCYLYNAQNVQRCKQLAKHLPHISML